MTLTTRFNQRSSAKLRRADKKGIYCVFGSMISWSNSRPGPRFPKGGSDWTAPHILRGDGESFQVSNVNEARVSSKKNKSYILDNLCSCGSREFGRRQSDRCSYEQATMRVRRITDNSVIESFNFGHQRERDVNDFNE